MYNYVVANFYFQLNFSFPLFLCMLINGNVHKNKGNLKLPENKINCNIPVYNSRFSRRHGGHVGVQNNGEKSLLGI